MGAVNSVPEGNLLGYYASFPEAYQVRHRVCTSDFDKYPLYERLRRLPLIDYDENYVAEWCLPEGIVFYIDKWDRETHERILALVRDNYRRTNNHYEYCDKNYHVRAICRMVPRDEWGPWPTS